MYCMKCGTEIPDSQVFCDRCLAEMEKHPVKPGTPVQLPVHEDFYQRRQYVPKKDVTPEEEIHFLRKINQWLMLLTTVLLLALCLSGSLVFYLWRSDAPKGSDIGQNYQTSITETGAAQPSAPGK